MCCGVCNVICQILYMERPLPSLTCKWFIKIRFRLDYIRKIRCNMLIHTSVQKPFYEVRIWDIIKGNIGSWLLSMAMKLRTLKGCMTKIKVKLAPDMIMKRTVSEPLWRAIIPYVLLSITIPLVGVRKSLKAMEINPVLETVVVVVGMLFTTKVSSTTTKITNVVIRTRGLIKCNIRGVTELAWSVEEEWQPLIEKRSCEGTRG